MKKQSKTEQPRDPLFVSKCHPETTVDWMEIVEDPEPSQIIAIVGRCHACAGVQRFYKCATNIDYKKLAVPLHGNTLWLLTNECVRHCRKDVSKEHGNINGTSIPQPVRAGKPMPQPDKDITESQDYDGGGGPY